MVWAIVIFPLIIPSFLRVYKFYIWRAVMGLYIIQILGGDFMGKGMGICVTFPKSLWGVKITYKFIGPF